MDAITHARKTMVVTTTPTTSFGLDELNAAVRDGWRILHLGVLGHTCPGEDDEWPDGHFSALVMLENSVGVRRGSESGPVAALGRELRDDGPNTHNAPRPNISWPEHAT